MADWGLPAPEDATAPLPGEKAEDAVAKDGPAKNGNDGLLLLSDSERDDDDEIEGKDNSDLVG